MVLGPGLTYFISLSAGTRPGVAMDFHEINITSRGLRIRAERPSHRVGLSAHLQHSKQCPGLSEESALESILVVHKTWVDKLQISYHGTAHTVFKKPLRSQLHSTCENCIKQRLKQVKELNLIDTQAYEDTNKKLLSNLLPFDSISENLSVIFVEELGLGMSESISSSTESTWSSTQPPTGSRPSDKRKGSILDRADVGRLMYKSDAQTEESRAAKKAQRKAQKLQAQAERLAQLNNHYGDLRYSLSPCDQLTAGYSMPLPTTKPPASNSSKATKSAKSSSQRMNFNIFKKRSTSGSTSQNSPPLLDTPALPLLSQERLLTESTRRRGSADSSSTAKSSITRRKTESHRNGAILDVMPMTFADIFLFGPPPGARSRTSSRRHSFSSQNARPSLTSSRRSVESVIRMPHEEFVFEFKPSSSEIDRPRQESLLEPISLWGQPQNPLQSIVLRDIFLSLLNDFSDTSLVFSYPKYGRVRRNSFSSSLRSVPHSTRIEEEEEEAIGKAIGGEESFLIDESITPLTAILEKRAWFLMAMKWLSFGRVLFSPGHHIIELCSDAEIGGRKPEATILDLDGNATADWSWHLADEYPFAKILNVLLPVSPRPPRGAAIPPNLDFVTATSLDNLSAIPSNSIDVVTSHNLPRLLFQDRNQSSEELHALLASILRECARILKPSGYFELTVVDPVMNSMGPRTRNWIMENAAPLHNMKPSKVVLAALEQLSGQGKEVLFTEVKECWVWMPTTSIGDELSTVTSMVGRHLYDDLFAPDGEEGEDGQKVEVAHGVSGRRECRIWKDEKIVEECQKENTAFRWLKCYARKA